MVSHLFRKCLVYFKLFEFLRNFTQRLGFPHRNSLIGPGCDIWVLISYAQKKNNSKAHAGVSSGTKV